MLLPVSDGVAVLGTRNNTAGLETGEVRIRSKGGAQIILKNDGSILFNGRVKIDREGRVSGWRTD